MANTVTVLGDLVVNGLWSLRRKRLEVNTGT